MIEARTFSIHCSAARTSLNIEIVELWAGEAPTGTFFGFTSIVVPLIQRR
jgi:hypothetical protein